MRAAWKAGFRIAGLLAITTLIAHCGDSSVHIRTGGGVNPAAGTFQGTTDDGGPIVIVVDSIRSIAFTCDGDPIAQTFNPPKSIGSDGTFSVTFTDGGREFHVSGTFTDQNHVEGDIDDEDNHCDGSFSANRSGVVVPTATRTSTPNGSVTETPTPGGPTDTGATPTGATPTEPTITPTPSENTCPTKLTVQGEGEQADLDTGFSGLSDNQKVIGDGTLSVALACPGTAKGSCGNCTVSGPIQAVQGTHNNRRCSTDSSIVCDATGTPASACPNGGSCAFFFGAPLPLSSGGVGVCVTNQVVGSIGGTANPDTGTGASTVKLSSKVHTAGDNFRPCPNCGTGGFGSTGTCNSGPKSGQPCTVDGTSVDFGPTSLDCPPDPMANVAGAAGLQIDLNPTTGTSTLAPSNTCKSNPFDNQACYCSNQPRANECDDGICTDPNGTGGTCEAGPFDQFCSIQTFRGCLSDVDCPTGTGNCQGAPVIRPCTGQTEVAGTKIKTTNSVTRTGTPSTTHPVLVSTFCVGAVSASAVNSAAGLPGPGALKLPSIVCYGEPCSF